MEAQADDAIFSKCFQKTCSGMAIRVATERLPATAWSLHPHKRVSMFALHLLPCQSSQTGGFGGQQCDELSGL